MIRSSVTDRFQTTIPKGVREALGLRRGDSLAYEVRGDEVMLRRRTDTPDEDPALLGFLDFLERDMTSRPDRLRPVPEAIVKKGRQLSRDVDVDLDAPL